MFLLKKILAALILPPAGPILPALSGLWLMRLKSRRWQHGGMDRSRHALNEYLGCLFNHIKDSLK